MILVNKCYVCDEEVFNLNGIYNHPIMKRQSVFKPICTDCICKAEKYAYIRGCTLTGAVNTLMEKHIPERTEAERAWIEALGDPNP